MFEMQAFTYAHRFSVRFDFEYEICTYLEFTPTVLHFVNDSFLYTELTFCHADKKWINQKSIGWLCIIYSFIIINYHFIYQREIPFTVSVQY